MTFRKTASDRWSGILVCGLILLSTSYIQTELPYDESVYLRLARSIVERGLPLRRPYEHLDQFQLFENSPPLISYVAAVTQRAFPGEEVPSRLVHIAAFALPTYFLVWRVVRVSFGAGAAIASLLVLLTNGSYMRATSHVLLNVPLGLFACIGLLAFHYATWSPVARRTFICAAAVATVLAVWTKYQAVCFIAAITAHALFTFAKQGFVGSRSLRLPLIAVWSAAAAATVALLWFWWTFGGPDAFRAALSWNARRMSPASMSTLQVLRGIVQTAGECEESLGGAILLVAAATLCLEPRHAALLRLFATYVTITILFNLIVFRLPGAGTSYLDSAVPALAILAGPGAVRLIELARTTAGRIVFASTMMALQVAGVQSSLFELPRRNASRVAAKYIASHSPPTAGVLADTVAIEFYTGHPVRVPRFTYPRDLVRRSLEGTSGDDISFVVVDPRAVHPIRDALQPEWDALLSRHFELAPAGAPGLEVYRRRVR